MTEMVRAIRIDVRAATESSFQTKDKELMTMKRAFTMLPHYSGKVEEYATWRFLMIQFLSQEPYFVEFLEWIENDIFLRTATKEEGVKRTKRSRITPQWSTVQQRTLKRRQCSLGSHWRSRPQYCEWTGVSTGYRGQRLRPRLVATTELHVGFWMAGMSHSSAGDSLVTNPSVRGRAKSWPHFRQEVYNDGGVPKRCFDYCFLRDHLGVESVPVMVGREKRTKMMIAHVAS